MDTQSPPPKPHRVSPADMKNPQGAWQEEESLEVYRRKRTQRPPTDGAPEIVRFVKRHPKSTEVVYETVQPRRDGRKEIILLEPVQLRDHSPDSLHDDYSLYRMEEYVDASSDIYTREKEPVYYTVEKSEKEQDSRDIIEKEEKIVEECLSPAKEIEEYSFERHEEMHRDVETTSIRERAGATPTPFEVCSYRPPAGAGEASSEEVLVERASTGERPPMPCPRCESEEVIKSETPLLDRTIYYEREVVQGEKTPERGSRQPSRQTLDVDEEIAHANRKVDSKLQEYAAPIPRSPQPSIQSSVQERRVEERRSLEEKMSSKKEHITKSERFLEAPKAHSEKRGSFAAAEAGDAQRSRDSSFEHKKYERTAYGPPSRPVSAARSTHSISDRSNHSQCYRHSREHEKSLMQERKTVPDVPIYTLTPPRRDEPRPHRSSTQKAPTPSRKDVGVERRPPITEIITTERFERIERIRRRYPVTPV
ncbi:hypothetical protein TELCIR_03735 [Teladorsagia circumcincta]|uniref:Uncharacterized protein n=1 Tax=Teladorsagia circumcincta TaxID=45464 RepID=A0A2G9UXM7_TELCI|nr:hypothetical protein TELCIR_03735 [Teladorsagia circumcincta]